MPNGLPGAVSDYGDNNYVLLGLIVEKRTGKSIRRVVKEAILDPLSLSDTGYYSAMNKNAQVEIAPTVSGYLKTSKELDQIVKLDPSFKRIDGSLVNTTKAVERIDSSSGMVSSARDLAIFGRAVYEGELLSKSSLEWLMDSQGVLGKPVGTSKQGVTKVYNESDGLLWVSNGDGPAGINVSLAYNKKTDRVMVGFTNIFGLFDESESMKNQIFAELIDQDL